MSRKVIVLSLPLIAALAIGLLFPLLRALVLSFVRYDPVQNSFTRSITADAYASFFLPHRGGVVLHNLTLALASTLFVAIICVPTLIGVKLYWGQTSALPIAEVLLALPLLFSQALRLHGLKLLLIPDGLVGSLYSKVMPEQSLLYNDVGVVVALAFSYAPLFALPLIQGLRSIGESTVSAARDLGLGFWRTFWVVLRLVIPALMAGSILMTVVAWFSPLEYEILGSQPSLLSMLEELAGVEKYPEAFAFALVPFFATILGLWVVVLWCKPERLIGFGDWESDE